MRLNLKKKYQEKKRVRPVKIRKITLNHSKELYKYQKKFKKIRIKYNILIIYVGFRKRKFERNDNTRKLY